MLRIRLRRVGAKKQPSFRIVVAERTAPRDGKFVEVIGFYNPRTEPETVRIEEARALHWLNVGASPSDSVARIFKTHGTYDRFERLKSGESLESLVAEAEAAAKASEEELAEVEEQVAPVEEVVAEEQAASEEEQPETEASTMEAGTDVETEVEEVAEVEEEEEAALEEMAVESEEASAEEEGSEEEGQ
jgi:small subunit ribosomal protein S16